MAIKGVIIGDLKARIALRMSLSYQSQWILFRMKMEIPLSEEHRISPLK